MNNRFVESIPSVSILLFVGAEWVGCAGSVPAPRTYLETSDVRVTEIHFDPSPSQRNAEFIELTNVGMKPLDLSGWQVTGPGRISLPEGTTLFAGRSAVICGDPTAFKKAFGPIAPAAVFTGTLKRSGETILVEDPAGKVAEEVIYDELDPVTKQASNTGRSLQRTTYKRDAANLWKAAEPTPGNWTSED